MTPWQKAKAWWDENVSAETFEETLGWHLTNGLIYSTPQVFLLAREAHWNGEEVGHDGEPNCWFIELASGSGGAGAFRQFMRVAPRQQPWVAWCRRGNFSQPKAYRWEHIAKKVRL